MTLISSDKILHEVIIFSDFRINLGLRRQVQSHGLDGIHNVFIARQLV